MNHQHADGPTDAQLVADPTTDATSRGVPNGAACRTLSPQALRDLEAGGTPPPIPVDPVALTPWATQAILALVKYATSYSGQVTISSPYIVATPPTWQDGPRWLKGATRHLRLMAGVELDADGMATVDGWIVTVSAGGAE